METRKLINKLGKLFPKRLANQYHDYVGLMCSKLPKEINRIYLCLDFDEFLLEDVRQFKPDIIFTHHPFIYGKKKDVFKYDLKKYSLYQVLEELNIPVYSFHTNFDEAKGGMNDALANSLSLDNIYAPNSCPIMRIGYLPYSMKIEEFVNYVKEKWNLPHVGLINEGKKEISKVSIVGGAGASDYEYALKEGVDIHISGDVSHHVRREITRYQFNYLDVPHEIESIFVDVFEKVLLDIDSSLIIKKVKHEKLLNIL